MDYTYYRFRGRHVVRHRACQRVRGEERDVVARQGGAFGETHLRACQALPVQTMGHVAALRAGRQYADCREILSQGIVTRRYNGYIG